METFLKFIGKQQRPPRYPKQCGEGTKVESSSYMISKYVLKLEWSEQNGTITRMLVPESSAVNLPQEGQLIFDKGSKIVQLKKG